MNMNDIRTAALTIKPFIKPTPLEYSRSLSKRFGFNAYVKYEMFQRTGSFKVRGAFNKMLTLTEAERSNGVVAVSGGNHAQAVAYAAAALGIRATILMAENTPSNYVDATRSYGAAVELTPTIAAAFEKAEQYQKAGRITIHPFDDPLVIAGQGTVAAEVVADLPEVSDIIVSIGGGGLAGGVCTAAKGLNPQIRIWGVETIGADTMARSLAAGEPVTLPEITSIARTLGSPFVTERTFGLAKQHIESVTVVSDADAVREVLYIASRLKVVAEPAAACTVAAIEALRGNFQPESNVVFILCGGNTSIEDICGALPLTES